MATPPTPLPTGNGMKVTLFFNFGRFGFTESYFLTATGGNDQFSDVGDWAARIVSARRTALNENFSIEAMRIEYISGANTGQAQLFFEPRYALGPGSVAAAGDSPWNAWLVSEKDSSQLLKGRRLLRGWANIDVLGYEIGGPNLAAGFPPRVVDLINSLNLIGGKTITGLTGTSIVPAMPGYNRLTVNPGGGLPYSPINQIDGVTLGANGRMIFTVTPGDPQIVTNSRILIRVKRARCVRGVSGQATVVNAPILGVVQTITTTKLFCCPGADLTTITGTIRINLPALYQYFPIAPGTTTGGPFAAERAVIKKTGRAFFGTRGRQSSRCC